MHFDTKYQNSALQSWASEVRRQGGAKPPCINETSPLSAPPWKNLFGNLWKNPLLSPPRKNPSYDHDYAQGQSQTWIVWHTSSDFESKVPLNCFQPEFDRVAKVRWFSHRGPTHSSFWALTKYIPALWRNHFLILRNTKGWLNAWI